MTEVNDLISSDLEPLTLELGKALIICQSLEESLHLLHSLLSHDESGGQEGAFGASWDFHSNKTLGNMINALRKRIDIPKELSDFLESGIKCRNEIVHGFVTRNLPKIINPRGRSEVECELVKLKQEVKKRDVAINSLLEMLFNRRGFSNEDLKKNAGEQWAYMNRSTTEAKH